MIFWRELPETSKTQYICLVKFLTLLFAFYIFLLPGVPCTDTDECKDNSQTASVSSFTDHKDHQHENETCNPFCNCTCCAQIFYPSFQPEKVVAAKPLGNLKQQFFYTNISLSSDFFGNIWQPPKVG